MSLSRGTFGLRQRRRWRDLVSSEASDTEAWLEEASLTSLSLQRQGQTTDQAA